jgi:hypothetical protein
MFCGFCPDNKTSFERADIFKRHLTRAHSVEQMLPSSLESLAKLKVSRGKTIFDYASGATGKCSLCSWTFSNAQSFYEHLDDCVLREVEWQAEASSKKTPHEGAGNPIGNTASGTTSTTVPQSINETPHAASGEVSKLLRLRRIACIGCIQRKVKCDRSEPTCTACTRLKLNCE